MRILFVDDEPLILEGLQNLLRRHRKRWDMKFAVGGRAALEQMAEKPFDIIVSDMRMPEMNGAELLQIAKEQYPSSSRVMLSGYSDEATTFQALPVAHQYISKPCDPQILQSVIENLAEARSMLETSGLREAATSINAIPSHPDLFTELERAVQQEEPSPETITQIVRQDPGMTVKVLQIVNSAFFGLPKPMTNIGEAVLYLGGSMFKSFVGLVEVFSKPTPRMAAIGVSLDTIREHSVLTARIAQKLSADANSSETTYTAGLLHDIGILVLAATCPEQLEAAIEKSHREQIPLYDAEVSVMQTTHSEVGAYLLQLWGLPKLMSQVALDHHAPKETGDSDIHVAVHVANILSLEEASTLGSDNAWDQHSGLDRAYLDRIGANSKLESWRKLAHAEVAAVVGLANRED